jgi:hypothetical protein
MCTGDVKHGKLLATIAGQSTQSSSSSLMHAHDEIWHETFAVECALVTESEQATMDAIANAVPSDEPIGQEASVPGT